MPKITVLVITSSKTSLLFRWNTPSSIIPGSLQIQKDDNFVVRGEHHVKQFWSPACLCSFDNIIHLDMNFQTRAHYLISVTGKKFTSILEDVLCIEQLATQMDVCGYATNKALARLSLIVTVWMGNSNLLLDPLPIASCCSTSGRAMK